MTATNIQPFWDHSQNVASEPLLESIPFPAALIDHGGIVRAANAGWLSLPEANGPGQSYLHFCQRVASTCGDAVTALPGGIRSVLAGWQTDFSVEYPIQGEPTRFLRISVTGYQGDFAGALILRQELSRYPDLPEPEGDADQRQAQKMESVGRLVGGVAHDFANLLTLIAGYSDILLNRINQMDPLRPELDEIRKAANRGARLTAQLLGFTRGQSLQPRAIDLNQLISDMQRMLQPIIGEYIEVDTTLSPGLGLILADPGQMEQVIMNLVLNARDAMPAGGKITIRTANTYLEGEDAAYHGMNPGACVVLTIADTGQGMDAETLAQVFQPFFTTKAKGKGTGLGLSTVHGIIRQSAGDVRVRSVQGKGTIFSIWLPQASSLAEGAEPASPVRPKMEAGAETILLVEDEDNVRRLLSHLLARRGYTVLEAAEGEEALRIFTEKSREIDLLLTDMVMPRMSGRELAEKIQQIKPGQRVIYMSGYTDDVLVRTGALSPGMSFLQKPLRPDALASKVREALDRPAEAKALAS